MHGRYVPGSLGFLLQLLRQRPRVHIMSRWRSICAAQSVSAVNGARGLDGVASTARCAGRARYRSVCRSYTGVTLTTLTGPRRSTSVANGYCHFSRSELHIGSRRLGRTQTQRTNGHRGRRSRHCSTRPTHASSRRVAPQRAMPPAEQQTCECEGDSGSEVDFEGSRGVESAPALAQMMNMDPGSGSSCTFGPLYASDRP